MGDALLSQLAGRTDNHVNRREKSCVFFTRPGLWEDGARCGAGQRLG